MRWCDCYDGVAFVFIFCIRKGGGLVEDDEDMACVCFPIP
jgi:hypothetical protein